MPHHWWLIDPDNPGPRQRAKAVRKAAREFGAEVVFVGHTSKNTWFALVNVEKSEDEERDLQGRRRPREALRARGARRGRGEGPRRRRLAVGRGVRRRADVPVEGRRPAELFVGLGRALGCGQVARGLETGERLVGQGADPGVDACRARPVALAGGLRRVEPTRACPRAARRRHELLARPSSARAKATSASQNEASESPRPSSSQSRISSSAARTRLVDAPRGGERVSIEREQGEDDLRRPDGSPELERALDVRERPVCAFAAERDLAADKEGVQLVQGRGVLLVGVGQEALAESERPSQSPRQVELVQVLDVEPAERDRVPEALGHAAALGIELERFRQVAEVCGDRREVVVAARGLGRVGSGRDVRRSRAGRGGRPGLRS